MGGTSPSPARGLQLPAALDQALHIAEVQSGNQIRLDLVENINLRIWKRLVSVSRERIAAFEAPIIQKADITDAVDVELSGRRWDQFQRWFDRHMAPELARLSRESGVPAVCAVRVSDRRGGHPHFRGSVYFIVFSPLPELSTESNKNSLQAKTSTSDESCSATQIQKKSRRLQELEHQNERLRYILIEKELEIDALRYPAKRGQATG